MNRNGEATLGEIMLVLVLIGVICFGGYLFFKKQSEINTFNGQSKQIQTTQETKRYALVELPITLFNLPGCARVQSDPPAKTQVVPVDTLTNSIVNTDKE